MFKAIFIVGSLVLSLVAFGFQEQVDASKHHHNAAPGVSRYKMSKPDIK
jgi:hypothetical protein